MCKKISVIILLLSCNVFSQDYGNHNISGNSQLNYQTFQEDNTINADKRKPYTSGYTNLLYNYNQLSIGTRLELYNNPIPGLTEYQGYGIANKFIQYKNRNIDVTIGNFYEEFGSGLILRSYFDPNLGIDNSINGFRLKAVSPKYGIYLTTLIGHQKSYWEYSKSLIRAINLDIGLNNFLLKNWESIINLGGSFVTKKEFDNDPIYILPANIGAFNGRISITKKNTSVNLDYAYKINDPSAENNYIYKNGNAVILTTNYSKKGLGVSFGAKRIQNMSFRSERNAILQDLNINYITPFTKQQAYSLATIYPYSSQANGEMGLQFDFYYTVPKKSKIGGKYGTQININFSNMFSINKTLASDAEVLNQSGTVGYDSNFWQLGEDQLFQEFNIEVSKKINRNLKLIGTYIDLINNDKILKSQSIPENKQHEIIKAKIVILESLIKTGSIKFPLFNKPARTSIRTEIQHLYTEQHFGNWAMGLIEYKISKLFFSVQDLYNYGYSEKPHYYSTSIGYNQGAHRITITYGKQRQGLFCVGGVCREVPASNGFLISLTSSF
tara:strand:+ start:4583 stop:6244 length:1662 start_codon:yes stop_codon:yes gene_type:complete